MRIALAALLLAVSATAYAQEVPPPKDDETTEAAAAAPTEEELLLAADEIGEKIGAIRGLPLLGPVKKGIKKREELRGVLLDKLAEQVDDADIEAEAAVFKRLGVIPQDLDYKEVLLDLLTSQVAGFYDPSTKELYVMEGFPMDMQRSAMAHELFHAVQDQHFDIETMRLPFTSQEHSDFALARAALIEGDATVLMFDFQMYEMGELPRDEATSLVDIPMLANIVTRINFDTLTSMEALAGSFGGGAEMSAADNALAAVPLIFRESLLFPYFAGMRFIVRSRSQRAWVDVDEIYKNPPVSTEQILHPEKYFAGEEPEWLDFDVSAALPGYEKIYDSVLGEFQMGQIFKAHPVEHVVPDEAVAGWDGDRVFAFQSAEGATALVHLTAWDTVEEAQEYYEALRAVSQRRYPAEFALSSGTYGQSVCARISNSERIYIEQWGDLVLHIEGAPSAVNPEGQETNAATFHARDLVWGTLKRTPFAEVLAERLAAQKEKATAE